MSFFMVDIEADGPIPGDYSMVSFAAVHVQTDLNETFFAELKPISSNWAAKNLEVTGYTRQQTLAFPEAKDGMIQFDKWIRSTSKGNPRFISDNAFDWMFMAWYFHHFMDCNPFGYSSWNLSSLNKGLTKKSLSNFSHLRDTPHTHHPLDDARGNAEAMQKMIKEYDMKIKL